MKQPLLPLVALAVGCQSAAPAARTPGPMGPTTEAAAPAAPAPADPTREAAKLDALLEAYFEAYLQMNPIMATFIQDPRYNYLLPNLLSPTADTANLAFERHWLHRVTSEVDRGQLEGQARLSYDVFVSGRQQAIEGAAFPARLMPITQFFSIPSAVAMFGSGKSAQPFRTVKDYEDWLVRLGSVAILFDQAIINMREGIEKKIVQPKIVVEKAIPQIAAHVVKDVKNSVFWMPVAAMPKSFPAADRKRLTAAYRARIENVIIPAYARLAEFMKREYLPQARDTHGYWALPDGARWYAHAIKEHTTTDRTAEALHQLGLAEVARIHAEMRQVMKDVGFEGDLAAFFIYAKENDDFYFEDEASILAAYRDVQAEVNARLPTLFDVMPKADYEVRPVEAFRAESSAAASYMPGSPDGSRPGVFYINTSDPRRRPKYGVETLSLHEASPGHHFQISIQQEVESLPKFRRFNNFTAYAEGWGLYAESIGKELGMFTDPMQYYGKLNDELLRAMRLVVDTGLHHKRWTRDQAVEYMLTNSSMVETEVVSEVERYIAMPGQALAYKVGQLAIEKIRKKAEAALGDRFDVKAFHRALLVDGAMPLDVLEKKMDAWIEARKTS